MPRMGNMGANQYQGYIDEMSGAGRQGAERYGIGMPYYRSAVDPSFDPKGNRQYRPNQDADRSFEQSHEVVTRKYLAYFTEKDPKKRAELLRDYNRTRSRVSRAMSGRREESSRLVDAANGTGADRRRSAAASREADDLGEPSDKPRSSSRLSGREPITDAGRRTSRAPFRRLRRSPGRIRFVGPPLAERRTRYSIGRAGSIVVATSDRVLAHPPGPNQARPASHFRRPLPPANLHSLIVQSGRWW